MPTATIDDATAAVNAKQGIAAGHEIANLRHQLDQNISTFSNCQQIGLAE